MKNLNGGLKTLATLGILSLMLLVVPTSTTASQDDPTCPDMNHDNHVNLVDVSMFSFAYSTGNLSGDFSHDSEVDDVDLAIMSEYLGQKLKCRDFVSIDNYACVDVNGDGNVNLSDLGMFGVAYFSDTYDATYDFNGDGAVNDIDKAILAADYGATGYVCE